MNYVCELLAEKFQKARKKEQISALVEVIIDLNRRISVLEGNKDPGIWCDVCEGTGKNIYSGDGRDCTNCDGKGSTFSDVLK